MPGTKQKNGKKRGKQQTTLPKRGGKVMMSRTMQKENANLFSPKHIRGDARMGNNGTQLSLALPSQNQAISMIQRVVEQDIWFYSLGFTTKALEKGYQAFTTTDYFPFFAYTFCQSLIKQLASGAIPALSRIPYVILAIGRALAQKRVGFSNGFVAYNHVIQTDTLPGIAQPLGYSSYGYKWNIGWPDPTATIDLFPTLTQTGFPAYTDEVGLMAFQEMVQFLANDLTAPNTGTLRLVDVATKTSLDSDVSTYAYSIKVAGVGAAGPGLGGVANFTACEVPIYRPYLTPFFSSTPPEYLENRFENFGVSAVGDAVYLGASMSSFYHEPEWTSKRYAKLNPVDFYEFGDVLSRFWCEVITTLLRDSSNFGADPLSFRNPLTLQETMFLLRNTLMDVFQETQAAVQSLYPRVPASTSSIEFVPFICGNGTCFKQTVGWKLPMPLVENMRALSARFIQRTATDVEWYIPILGQYRLGELTWSDYTYMDASGNIYPFYPDPSLVLQKRTFDEKTSSFSYVPMAEVDVSLVDGQGAGLFVCINDPPRLETLAMMFNDFITSQNLATYSTPLVIATPENGINLLTSVTMTRQWNNIPNDPVQLASAKERDTRQTSKTYLRLVGSPYELRQALVDSSQSSVVSAAYESVLSVWILPCDKLVLDDGPNSTPLTRIQGMRAEPYSVPITASITGKLISNMHQNYAQKMVKGKTGSPSDWDQLFIEMAAKGRGGILSGLVAGFADMIIPGSGSVVKTIGGIIGV